MHGTGRTAASRTGVQGALLPGVYSFGVCEACTYAEHWIGSNALVALAIEMEGGMFAGGHTRLLLLFVYCIDRYEEGAACRLCQYVDVS